MTHHPTDNPKSEDKTKYRRFTAMIITGMFFMYWSMYISSWELSHVRFSQSRIFMTFTMGGIMGIIMLIFMLNMYKNKVINSLIILLSLSIFALGVILDRTQITVGDLAFMDAMIPHHSLAITRAERAKIEDIRLCELAVDISQAQRHEIQEMEWLLNDIEINGVAKTKDEAENRQLPEFETDTVRECP
jgi:hypothetical protein